MSIAVTGYMSNEDIIAWMQEKTTNLYSNMSESMAGADNRADAESALNAIKAALVNDKGKDATEVQQMIDDALTKYGDIPEVAKLLQPMQDELKTNFEANSGGSYLDSNGTRQTVPPRETTISSDESDHWSQQIGEAVDALGKQDQLSMINIQEFNSEINQAKQTASALLDAADKSANTIINHIS